MSILTRTPSDHPADLAAELADARAAYDATRNSVITRARDRQNAIAELQKDLEVEYSALDGVISKA